MNIDFLITDFKLSVKQWLRSKGTVFWTILFPILLIVIFGAIFSDTGSTEYDLTIQDLDETTSSEDFIKILENVSILNIETIGKDKDIAEYMKDNDKAAAIQIPVGFKDILIESMHDNNVTFDIVFYFDPDENTTSMVLRNIVSGIVQEFNMGLTQGRHVILIDEESTLGEDFDYIDFFVPGMIGFTIMTSMVYGSIERNTKYRKDGILRKLLTMPITRAEWIFSKMLFMLFLSFISTSVILIVGMLVWGLTFHLNIFFFIIIISTSFLFSGMGMIIARFVKEEETADMAGGAITFPMMFLAGTFFPLDQMPEFMQSIAQFLPLYYVNEGFRNAMIYADLEKTLFFTTVVLVFALIFFIIGVLLTKWKED
jgi:ABC-2 type transport system permease protein